MALLQKNDHCCSADAVRRSLAGTETKLPQIRLSSTGNDSTSCRHGSYFVCFDDGEDAALLSDIVIANHLGGLISDDKNILHSAVSSQRVDCVLCRNMFSPIFCSQKQIVRVGVHYFHLSTYFGEDWIRSENFGNLRDHFGCFRRIPKGRWQSCDLLLT